MDDVFIDDIPDVDGIILLFEDGLLAPMGAASPPEVGRRGPRGQNRRQKYGPTYYRKNEDEEDFEMLMAAMIPAMEKREEDEELRQSRTVRIQTEGHRLEIERRLNPPAEAMPPQIREYFVRKGVERAAEQSVKRELDKEAFRKDVAMRLKMAKVRAAKRKK